LILVGSSRELLDLSRVPANTLQEVCKRVDKTFTSYLSGDKDGKRSGKPRFESESRYRSLVFEGKGLGLHSCSVGGKFLYLTVPKLGLIKICTHRDMPESTTVKQVKIVKKADAWSINFILEDMEVENHDVEIEKHDVQPVIATWENSMGLDAVLHGDDFIATSYQFIKYLHGLVS
jgi:putative transposase